MFYLKIKNSVFDTLGCNDFKDIEASAKKVKMGVWSDSKFEMPWDYRKRMVSV